MELSSNIKCLDEAMQEDVAHIAEELDLNGLASKGIQEMQNSNEFPENGIQADSNQDYCSPPRRTSISVNNDGSNPQLVNSDSTDHLFQNKIDEVYLLHESDMHHDDDGDYSDRRMSECHYDSVKPPMEAYYHDDKTEQVDIGDFSHEMPDKHAEFDMETRNKHPDQFFKKLLLTTEDNENNERLDNESLNYHTKKPYVSDEIENGDFSSTSPEGLVRADFVHEDMAIQNSSVEVGDIYPSETAILDPEGGHECLNSPQTMQHAMASPKGPQSDFEKSSPVRPVPESDASPREENFQADDETNKLKPNMSPSKRKRSPEKYSESHKRVSSQDRLSPLQKGRSPSGRRSESRRRDQSPRKRSSISPRRHESPRRRDRSASRSPIRRRDSSSHRREHRGRSRSKSPLERDRHRRSPRRRHSPRRRTSPGYFRRRSPRRPWSPPANRNTGIGRPGRNLFVAGFSYITTERELERKFSRFGRVTDVRIVRDRRSGESRGFGFLSLERDEDADAAIRALDQTEWNGRIVLVEKSKTGR